MIGCPSGSSSRSVLVPGPIIDTIAGIATQAGIVVVAAQQDDGAGAVAGGAGALRVGEAARLQKLGDHRPVAQRAVAAQLGADGIGELLATGAGRIEDEGAGALDRGQPREVAGDARTPHVVVGLFDDLAAPVVERGKRGRGIALEQRLDRLAGVVVGLADDLGELVGVHAVVLALVERTACGDAAELGHVADQHEPCLNDLFTSPVFFIIDRG